MQQRKEEKVELYLLVRFLQLATLYLSNRGNEMCKDVRKPTVKLVFLILRNAFRLRRRKDFRRFLYHLQKQQ